MKNKFTPALKCCFITVALASLSALLANGDEFRYSNIVASDFFTEYPDQLEFPIVLVQPLNQLVPAGASATFTVWAVNEPLAYQWMRNGVIISGETTAVDHHQRPSGRRRLVFLRCRKGFGDRAYPVGAVDGVYQ